MKNKKQIILILILVVLIFAGALFFVLHKKVSPPTSTGTQTNNSALDWSAKIPEIRTALGVAFPTVAIGQRSPISIIQTADVTGDGIPEALVDMGTGGASTDDVSLVGYQHGVVVLSWTGPDSSLQPINFPQGSASLHASEVGLDSSHNTIYAVDLTYKTNGTLDTCTPQLFRWNSALNAFEFYEDATLNATYCNAAAAANS